MQQKRVLIISPVPTHPQNAGNRARVFHLATALSAMDCEVHFLFTGHEAGDLEAMKRYWQVRFYSLADPCQRTALPSRLQRLYCFFRYSKIERTYNIPADAWYFSALDPVVSELQKKQCYDLVLVEYIFLSKALLHFGSQTLKIIDTHDIFTNRFQLYLNNNQAPQWFSTYRSEEEKALNRADVVIAIQKHEKEYFESLVNRKVIQVGHLLPVRSSVKAYFEKTLLFVASANPINIEGTSFFVEQVFKKLLLTQPDVKLIIAGSICKVLERKEQVVLWGEFAEPQNVYDAADIVINPIRFGTGINIKTIEALSYGKVLVATTPATSGLEEGRNKAFLVADTVNEFVAALTGLIDSADQRAMLQHNAEAFMRDYQQYNGRQLRAALTL
jgi:glycosyltransferase involved in cell wall biosynthesis